LKTYKTLHNRKKQKSRNEITY